MEGTQSLIVLLLWAAAAEAWAKVAAPASALLADLAAVAALALPLATTAALAPLGREVLAAKALTKLEEVEVEAPVQ
jgi:hypothetical protein